MIVMIIFLSFFVTLCFASVTRIPFTIRGDESLRMTAWSREDTPFELVVTSNSYSESVRRCGETIHLPTTTNTESSMVRFRDRNCRNRERASIPVTRESLGAGIDSHLMETFESIAVVKFGSDRGELVLGASREYFLSNCHNSTSIDFYYSRLPGRRNRHRFDARLQFENSAGPRFSAKFADIPGNAIADVHELVYTELVNTILDTGANLTANSDNHQVFTNCHRGAVIDSLTPLSIQITSQVMIQLYPEDYVLFEAGPNQCRLRLSPHGGESVPYYRINPFAIPGMNVRLTSTRAEFCDSL